MAVPKRKTSKSRKHTRRAHDALPRLYLVKCPRCSQAIVPHTVCGNCGYYRQKMIVDMEALAAGKTKSRSKKGKP